MFTYNINGKASRHFTYADLINCGNTAQLHQIENLPKQPETWRALSALATRILDPIVDQFGPINLTYGFCSPELARLIAKNPNPHIAPKLDQHCAHELNIKQAIICSRLGAACDFTVLNKPDGTPNNTTVDMQQVALWICQNLKFDRLYYYGKHRPLHISFGPQQNQFLQTMKTNPDTGHRVPSKKGRGPTAISVIEQVDY
ncbi:hypothetical protein GCM10009347_09780 [Shewanella algicola]|uniref:Peptidase M15A C-terminal domain-containing protein n=1 Tax=Shewanella algicola TaxID=640633 RepID=A0A9X1Z2T4_9GAMM|nr:hypothetical protein [Shewanella algicola]MCL1104586.1 hypothetical protein [Shewanella algicola]GGP44291.1 hypothetical protein GCM10009347_09780 [Shewanella algicola]